MKKKEYVLYDDTEDYKKEDETREYLFEEYAEEEGWTCKENIPDERVYEEIAWRNQYEWDDMKDILRSAFRKGHYIMTGTCGRWDGRYDAGNFINDFEDFQRFISHLDNIKITDVNGHFIVEGYHHDGSDRYELKRLTNKGYEMANNNYFAHDRKLHTTIMTCNLFSALPRIAQTAYGV